MNSTADTIGVLLVEDNPGDARLIRETLADATDAKFGVVWADRLAAALDRAEVVQPDVVLLDLGLPDSQGHATFSLANRRLPETPIIVLTGLGDDALALRTLRDGAQDYLVKGELNTPGLVRAIRYAIGRGRVERELRRSEGRYRSLLDGVALGICRVAESGRMLDCNPAYLELLGYTGGRRPAGLNLAGDVFEDAPAFADLVARCRRDRRFAGVEARWRRRDGEFITVRLSGRLVESESGAPDSFQMIAEDVTDLRVLEEQYRQSQKLEAVGRLAGGVAHDFNNLLTIIIASADLLLAELEARATERAEIEEIRQAARRAADLTRQLLAFSRQQIVEPRALDLNDVVSDVQRMLRRLIGEDVRLVTRLQRPLPSVSADRGQIEQILLNLAVNARDAMPRGGELTISTEARRGDVSRDGGEPAAADHVIVSVTDTGTGIAPENIDRIFEPFFTTKEQGKGTGLGLATVYGIVQQNGGEIQVTSEPGRGTAFRITLPGIDAEPAPAPIAIPRGGVLDGSETILVVEDEEAVRHLVRRILTQRGYTVLTARNGIDAVAVAERHGGVIDLLLSDVVMPGMSGPALAARFRLTRPDLRILFFSGYTGDAIDSHGGEMGAVPFIQKPFTPRALAEIVRHVLDGPEQTAGS